MNAYAIKYAREDCLSMKELIERLTLGRSGEFVWETDPALDGFEISARQGKICLRARDTSTLSAALGEYLRAVAGVDLAWLGDGLDRLPASLPLPEGTIARAIPQKYRSAFNYCTFSYTMVWWDWARWERELDHMALSGINLPLMTVGLEGVWYDTLLEFGLSDEEARSFLCGPAFLAWQWLTNIEDGAARARLRGVLGAAGAKCGFSAARGEGKAS